MDKPDDRNARAQNLTYPTPSAQVVAAPSQAEVKARPRRFGRLLRNPKLTLGAAILLLFIAAAVLAPVIAPGDPTGFVAAPHQPPSAEYPLGTEGQGKDVFAQTVWGSRVSLAIGLSVGLLATISASLSG